MRRRVPLFNTDSERDGLRRASRANAQLLDYLRPFVVAGTTTAEIDRLAYSYTLEHGHTPACLGYPGEFAPYPNSICTSVNEVVCHGVPDDRPLLPGDIVNVDLTTIVDGWFGDQSEMFLIGDAADISDEARHLVQVAFDSLYLGIRAIEPGGPVDAISRAIYDHARGEGLDVVREYQGHGIGRQFHQEPGIAHVPSQPPNRTPIHPGTCFTIEPMINTGTWHTNRVESDGWTVRTRDGGLSAQWEHTVLMTEEGPEILTLTEDGPQEGDRI